MHFLWHSWTEIRFRHIPGSLNAVLQYWEIDTEKYTTKPHIVWQYFCSNLYWITGVFGRVNLVVEDILYLSTPMVDCAILLTWTQQIWLVRDLQVNKCYKIIPQTAYFNVFVIFWNLDFFLHTIFNWF